jgi:hypothetical protein
VKHNLGKLLCLVLLFVTLLSSLNASDFDYHVEVDKINPYLKEAVLLTFDVNQSNHDMVLLFDFDLKKSETYTFQRVDIQEKDAYHNMQIRYTYLLYPLKKGTINIAFILKQKATTDESVAYSFSGDRDNVKGLVTKDTDILVPPLHLDVKALPKETQLVGYFTLEYRIKTHKAKAYEPLPLEITLHGKGYPPLLPNLLAKTPSFTSFTEKPLVKSHATMQGTNSTVTYPMALSHDKSFTLKPLFIKAFNPQEQKSYLLTVPQQIFHIAPIPTAQLLDPVDMPSSTAIDWSWLEHLLEYLLIFGAGYFTAILSQKYLFLGGYKKSITTPNPLTQKIKQSSNHKALLQLLLAQDSPEFTSTIERLESSIYSQTTIPLSTLKKEALEQRK